MKILITVLLTMIAASGAFAQTDAPAKTEMTQTADSIADGPVVELTTSLGTVRIRLYNDTPLHRDNFLRLVNDGTYDGVLFHRVIDGFMIQTGDPDSKTAKPGDHLGAGDLGYTVEAEIRYPRHYHKYGALAAARTGDAMNPERRSSGSQFYIVTGRVPSERELESMELRQNQSRLQARFRRPVHRLRGGARGNGCRREDSEGCHRRQRPSRGGCEDNIRKSSEIKLIWPRAITHQYQKL